MTNKEMLCTALKQSALELNCTVDDLTGGKSKAVISRAAEGAKISFAAVYCQLISYGSGIVASVNEERYMPMRRHILRNTRLSIALKRRTCSFCSPRLSGGA